MDFSKIETNFYGAMRVALSMIPLMKKNNDGHIVNISSGLGQLSDMGGPQAPLSVEKGAKGIVWAATLPDDGPTGGFFAMARRFLDK